MKKSKDLITEYEILETLGFKELSDITKLDKREFYKKVNNAIKEMKTFYKKEMAKNPRDKDVIRKVKNAWTRSLKNFKRKNNPIYVENSLMLKNVEKNKVRLFFTLRKDLDELDKFFKENFDKEATIKLCTLLAYKYKLDNNKEFLKQYKLVAKNYSYKYLKSIRLWIGIFLELLYTPGGYNLGSFEELLLENDIFFETEEERKEEGKANFIRKKDKVLDVFISGILVVCAVICYVIGGLIQVGWLTSILLSIATSFLVTFLVDLLGKFKNTYFNKRKKGVDKILIFVLGTKSNIVKYYEMIQKSKKSEETGTAFINYCNELKKMIDNINPIKTRIYLDMEPFNMNYKALTRYYKYFINPIYVQVMSTNFDMQEKDRQSELDELNEKMIELADSSYGVVLDILDGILLNMNDEKIIENVIKERCGEKRED